MATWIDLPISGGGGGSLYWGDPVANVAALPPTGAAGEVRMVLSTHELYYWNEINSDWELLPTSQIDPADVADTDSVDLTVTAGILSADVNLSSDPPDSGYIESEIVIAANGLRAQVANSEVRGLISSGDPILVYDDATGIFTVDQAEIDHGSLEPSSLLDDDHPQYLLLAGRAPSQTAAGNISFTGLVTVPRLTTAQINALVSPLGGALVYDTDVDLPKMYIEGTYNAWVPMMGWGS